ncbi:hypothetical protein GC176_23645 [bacterium]|nr:hypothetical protein [bacterium]
MLPRQVTNSNHVIDSVDHENVLGRFEQLNPSRELGGSGPGLAIVNRISEVHNGASLRSARQRVPRQAVDVRGSVPPDRRNGTLLARSESIAADL